MAYFIVRIELHELDNRQKPTWDDYERLHIAMQRRNYFRLIKSDEGKWYHLPHATYFAYSDTMTSAQILEQVQSIGRPVWSKTSYLVAEGSSRWEGLVPASAQDVQRLAS